MRDVHALWSGCSASRQFPRAGRQCRSRRKSYDLRHAAAIAADNATFGEPEVRFSAVGPAIVMPMIIGYKKARELLYFGDQIDAKTALDLDTYHLNAACHRF